MKRKTRDEEGGDPKKRSPHGVGWNNTSGALNYLVEKQVVKFNSSIKYLDKLTSFAARQRRRDQKV
jgi:hypothetical protein